jgi:hypothetical protein
MQRLYATVRGSQELVAKSRGVLVFPSVVHAGFVVGSAACGRKHCARKHDSPMKVQCVESTGPGWKATPMAHIWKRTTQTTVLLRPQSQLDNRLPVSGRLGGSYRPLGAHHAKKNFYVQRNRFTSDDGIGTSWMYDHEGSSANGCHRYVEASVDRCER